MLRPLPSSRSSQAGRRARRPRSALAGAAVLMVGLALTGCGDDDEPEAAACGPITVDPLDTNQGHLLPGAPTPSFRSDPPTSGPHVAGLIVQGEMDRPVTPLEQVSTLETGAVIIQYESPDDRRDLAPLARPEVVVAPAEDLPAPIVATGWVRSMRCDSVDVDALRRFIDAVGGEYEGHPAETTGGG